jgi:hypothetical protein
MEEAPVQVQVVLKEAAGNAPLREKHHRGHLDLGEGARPVQHAPDPGGDALTREQDTHVEFVHESAWFNLLMIILHLAPERSIPLPQMRR